MILIDFACDVCKHQRDNIDGWKCCCDAFPDGTPNWIFRTNPRELNECNNGIKFEEKVFELDKYVEDGIYCVGLKEDDLNAFAEHAKKRKQSKKMYNKHVKENAK